MNMVRSGQNYKFVTGKMIQKLKKKSGPKRKIYIFFGILTRGKAGLGVCIANLTYSRCILETKSL